MKQRGVPGGVGEYGQSHRRHRERRRHQRQAAASESAKLFYDYLLSRPAQQRLHALRRMPARPDIEPFSPNGAIQVEAAGGAAQTGPQFNQTIKEFREIFGL